MIGTKLAHYEITAHLGSGGMGDVYQATDTKLGRSVAIKFLPEAFSHDTDRVARFQREARVLASLNHSNIAAIYGVEEIDGRHFLVMELVSGETLADRIKRGVILIEEALPIAKQIAEALEEAHEKGIIHRDLKPANIKITPDGKVKVLDFGLAKVYQPEQTDVTASNWPTISMAATNAGVIQGTAAYMSPEQASGKTLDARSDVFSFGAVFYEMLCGRRAFNGDSNIAMMAAVLRDEPYPLHSPPELVQIVRRCLYKSPADRFQTMAKVKASIAAVKLGEPAPAIAVLPFANMSTDKEQEYFSDGLAEEIINALAQIPGLKVTARTSAFAFRGKEQDITKIAEALHVGSVLEGSVRRSGNRLRVTAQLINAADGYQLWSQRYDRELSEVFAMQDEIAAAIASALQLKLVGKSTDRRAHEPNLRAYEAFLRGRHLVFVNTAESIALAKEAFEQAVEVDAEYSEAYAELATWHFIQGAAGLRHATQTMPIACRYAQKALELTPAEPRALAVLGAVAALYEHDWKKAGERFQLALAAEQVPPEVRFRCALFYLLPLGRLREALDHIDSAVEQDPLNVLFRGMLALILGSESPDRAAVEAQKAIQIDDRHWIPYYAMSMNHFRRGDLRQAVQFAERSARAIPLSLPAGLLTGLLRRLGENDRADTLLSNLRAPSGMSIYYMVCSEFDAAADALSKAIAQGEVQILMWFAASDFLKPLRSSPHWPALANMMNLPPEVG